MKSFSTISEYIDSFTGDQKNMLLSLYKIIREHIPDEAVEKISYQMPTFYFNGNLIHFAMFKKHLGIYPGPEAITYFKEDLTGYKTSKGAIQLLPDQPLPKELIKNILHFNLDKLKDKKVPNWHAYKEKWIEAEEFMQQLIVKTTLDKSIKWGTEVYTCNNKNVIGWGGFKNFFSLWFYNGVFLTDPYKVLVNASDGKTKAMRQWRFTRREDMDEQKILSYINESVQTIKDGKEIKPAAFKKLVPDELFKEFLNSNAVLQVAFYKLTKGKQNEYITYITEAKQHKTKLARLQKIKPFILEGKGLNDKYRSK